jgi:hypothetical protein
MLGYGDMQAKLKGLHSPDVSDLKTYIPDQEDNFGFLLQIMVGPSNGNGEESFDTVVCTPKWLLGRYSASDVILGLHKLIVFQYDYSRLLSFIETFLAKCSGENWNEIASKLSDLGHWEFEGYERATPKEKP